MTVFPNSGKFWLKTLFYSLLTLILIFVGLQAMVYQMFSTNRLNALTQDLAADTRRRIHFDADIQRQWFPRPTVTLKNLIITHPDSTLAAVYVRETDIGLAWKSLWHGQPVIDKWVVKGAEISAKYNGSEWSLQDLQQSQSTEIPLDRLIIEDSTLRLGLPKGMYQVQQFSLNSQLADGNGRTFQIEGTLNNDSEPLHWQGSGLLKTTQSQWDIPALQMQAQGRLKQHQLHLHADTALTWLPQQNTLQARHLSLRADSDQKLHLTAEIPAISFNTRTERLNIHTLSGAFTAGEAGNQWDGSFKVDKAFLLPTAATSELVEVNGSHKSLNFQTHFTATAPLLWQRNKGFQFEQLRLTTLQDTLGAGSSQPRFASTLQGSFSLTDMQHWQGSFKGFFDRQATALNIQYRADDKQPAQLKAGIALQKLSLTPYWTDLQAKSGNIYPEFLNARGVPDIAMQINIGSILIPGLQLDHVDTLLTANREHVTLSNFKAGLYGGHTEGGISMANTEPVSYRLQQNAQNVQIRPLLQDLFGFHNISGTGDAVIDLATQGNTHKNLLQSLNGTLSLNVANGIWHGIDLNNILHSGKVQQPHETMQTPFHSFTLSSDISNGISKHENAELISDSLHVNMNGYTDLSNHILSEQLLIYNARNPQSKPIPLKISGPILNPSLTLDYRRLTDGLNTPQEKQKALEETFREQWQWLRPK